MNSGISTNFFIGKISFLGWIFCLFFHTSNTKAQVVIPAGNPADSSIRFPITSWYDFNRSAIIYKSSEIGLTNRRLVSLGFYLERSNPGCKASNVNIRLKATPDSVFLPGGYNDLTTGTQLVYSGTIAADSFLTDSVWISLPFQTPFDFSGNQNLLVLVESDKTTDGNDPNNLSKQYRLSQSGQKRFQCWWSDNLIPQGQGVLYSMRPNVRLGNIAIPPNCSGQPVPGLATANPLNLSCPGQLVQLSLSNIPAENGISFQWQRKPQNGTTWEDIAGATFPNHLLPVFGNFNFRCRVSCSFSSQSAFSDEVNPVLTYSTVFAPLSQGFGALITSEGQQGPWNCQYFQATNSGTRPWRGTLGRNTNPNFRGVVGRTDSAALYSGWSTDSYLFLPGINMSSDSIYKFRFYYKHSRPGDNNEGPNFEVRIGNLPDPAFQTNLLDSKNNQNDTLFQAQEVSFRPLDPGLFFFSIRNRTPSSNPFFLVVDDFSIEKELFVSNKSLTRIEGILLIKGDNPGSWMVKRKKAQSAGEVKIISLEGKQLFRKIWEPGQTEMQFQIPGAGIFLMQSNENQKLTSIRFSNF